MNVANLQKHTHLKKSFKEDSYGDITTFRNSYKKKIILNQKLKKIFQINQKTEKESEANSGQTDFYESDLERHYLFINKSKNDPVNVDFDLNFEIEMHGPFDYLFELRGILNKPEYVKKTEKIRNFPKHLKYSLFCNEHIREIRKVDFTIISSLFEIIKRKGNRMYKNKLYRESIDNYFFAYSMLKWLEFKDDKKRYDLLKFSSLEPIFDDDIYQDQIKIEDLSSERDSYRYSLIYLLLAMSYSFIQLRHFKDAIECLDECISLSGEKMADPYFRRCQARMCNKFSDEEQLMIALADIQKAKSISIDKIYDETYLKLMILIEQRQVKELEKLNYFISQVKSENKSKDFSTIYSHLSTDEIDNHEKQFQMLKEMKNKYKLAIKFYSETRNEEQLQIAYKEIDKFYEIYYLYKYYYNFSTKKISKQLFSLLKEEDRILFINEHYSNEIDKVKNNIAELIFFSGNYNTELYKYVSEKVGYKITKKIDHIKKLPLPINQSNTQSITVIEKTDHQNSFALFFLLLAISIGLIGFHIFWSSQNSKIFGDSPR